MQGEAMQKTTRKNSPPLKVYCLPDERIQIEAQAKAAGLSLSTYLLRVGLGYRIKGMLDHKRVEELVRINGELGRLAGLLTLWLAHDPRTAAFSEHTLRAVLSKIEDTQDEMQEIMRTVVLSRHA